MLMEIIFKEVVKSLRFILVGTIFLMPIDSFALLNSVSNSGGDNENNLSDTRWPRSIIRPQIDLDGEWEFRIDPKDVGQQEKWFDASVPFEETILVPGAWDAQGVGEETDKIINSYIGKAWYRRIVKIPSDWTGKKVFLRIGGVHRYADVWINGKHVRRHVGYVVDFEIDLTKYISPGNDVNIAIRVDSEQDWDIDALTGAFDMIDYMYISWGGIHQHVWLEARSSEWIEDAFVKPNVTESKIDVEVALSSEATGEQELMTEIIGPEGNIVASTSQHLNLFKGNSNVNLSLSLDDPLLWSPNHPWLYRLRLSLLDGDVRSDDWEIRFGMREIEIRGADIYLNGKKTYLHGYGDDSIYPKTICPPADHKEYRERMKLIKEFGFNYVRHHSSVPLPEYFDVADELGILVQPELPIAYERFLMMGLEHKASKELYIETWRGMIKRYRNHPSVFGWCMSNEMYGGFEFATELYDIAKKYDSTRPVYDTDGVPPDLERPTLDVLPVQFDVKVLPVKSRTVNQIPKRDPMHPLLKPITRRTNKFIFESPPTKPVIGHEMGNYVTYPNVHDAEKFRDNVKPFWLEQAHLELEKRGMLDEVERLAKCSENLQALSHKINIERLRMSPYTDGHSLWLFQDYWTTNVGLVNTYFEVKGKGPEYYSKFISDVVLLADMPAYTFTSGEMIEIPMLISDYGEEDIVDGKLSWVLQSKSEEVIRGEFPPITIKEKGVSSLGSLSLLLPQVESAKKLNLKITLNSAAGKVGNDWNIWIFPDQEEFALPDSIRVVQQGLDYLSDKFQSIIPINQSAVVPEDTDLLITQRISKYVLDYLEQGGNVILTSAWPLFETEISTFEPAWWKGDPVRDASAGTVIYDSPTLDEFPHDGWCDLQFLELIDNRYVLLLDDVPGIKQSVIRAIDTYGSSRQKAYLAEWRIGSGALLVSTLNMDHNVMEVPEASWLLRSLVRYAVGKDFSPEAELSVEFVAKRMGHKSKRPVISGAEFKYYFYEGFWTGIPDYLNITPLDSGYVSKIRLEDIKFTDKENYALLIQGFFEIKQAGGYIFYSASNDGSLLSIDNIKVVDNNGSHGLLEKSGSIYLSQGVHFLEVHYFQRGGGQGLNISYEGPNFRRQEIQPLQMSK